LTKEELEKLKEAAAKGNLQLGIWEKKKPFDHRNKKT